MFAKKFFSFSLYRLKNILCTNVPKQTNSNITSLYHKMYHLSTFVSFMSVVSVYVLVILHLVSLLCSDMKKVEMMFVSFYYYMIHITNTVQQRSSCVQQQNRLQCKMNPFHKYTYSGSSLQTRLPDFRPFHWNPFQNLVTLILIANARHVIRFNFM